ncbi:MAG: hypothetical protein N2203_03010, partial [Bacteroidia bacterium]|nr:hypothetical protein [Bacteroidia bacterium]
MKTMSHLHFILIILAITSSSAFAQNNVSMVDGTMNDTASYNAIGWGLIILLLIQILVLRSLSSAIRSVSNSDIFKNNSKFFQNILVIGGVLFSFHSFAQEAGSSEPLVSFSELDIYILIALNFLLSLIVIWMYYQFQQILKYAGILKEEEPKSTIWDIEHWLTKSVPIEKEATIQFDHEYDGIRELDNVLPPWWLWMFYATIIFSVVYLVHYHLSLIHI